eukprot:m.149349 g.149349  ORF g.149349 m.149349 type:complete len:610 (-) comp30652_c0_seq1:337-2166(-)
MFQCTMIGPRAVVFIATLATVSGWRVCDVTSPTFGAVGDGNVKDTTSLRLALTQCNEVLLPAGRTFLSGPLNLTSNQVFRVDGTLLASVDKHDFPLIQPLMGYGWGDDENCFPPGDDSHKIIIGSYRYSPVIGVYHATNVTITGSGVIDGQGEIWWTNCTACHYPPGNNSAFCEVASRPKLIETQFVDGFRVLGAFPQSVQTDESNAVVARTPAMDACRITVAKPFALDPSTPVPSVHNAYAAFTPASVPVGRNVSFIEHSRSFCGTDGKRDTHAVIAFSSNNYTLAECQAQCVALKCTCLDYVSPTPSPPPTPPSPPTPPTPFPPTPPPPPSPGTLTLQNSPFWTLTPSYSQNIHVANLRILAPMDRIGNTDGVNIDSCRNVLVENVWIKNSDDGVCIKSGLNGFGLNLGIPTENVLIRNITCPEGGRGGFAIGSEMSGGLRNVTYRDSVLRGERGINIKPSVGRGGYIHDLTFENINTHVGLGMGGDGDPLMKGNDYVPLISNLHFINISGGCSFSGCAKANRSQCFGMSVSGCGNGCVLPASASDPLPPQMFACKTTATTMFGKVVLPWGVCLPLDAPVNLRPDYPNWGPTTGNYTSLTQCQAACK